jgi:mannose-6-phosphate isomerase
MHHTEFLPVMTTELYPLQLNPSTHVKVWGGRKLETDFNKTLPDDSPYGESWELHDSCTVANGPHAGCTIGELVDTFGTDIVGEHFDPADGLPLLVKLLDATEWLSVQVHPDDEQAQRLEGDPRGKTEAWVILDADHDAELVIGIEPGTSEDEMAQAIRDNALEECLVFEDVEAGDVLYMPANTVHAIGPGIVLYEVQQSSDVTYRLYDWGRVGLDGEPRDLHIEKGVEVSNLETLPAVEAPGDEQIVDGDFFQTARYHLEDETQQLPADDTFHSLTCINGTVRVCHDEAVVTLRSGDTAFIPAAVDDCKLTGEGTVLVSHPVID